MRSTELDAPLFLGVDGGGTKTCFVLLSAAGQVRAKQTLPTAYHLQIGVEGLHATLQAGVQAVLSEGGVESEQVAHAFFGLPAYGEDSRITPLLDAMPEAVLGHHRFTCGNDMICGWAGSLGGGDGISITAGTGSIGYGEHRARTTRAGGWGEVFSDEGSAYWIAARGLNLFSKMSDGRLPRGPLYGVYRDHFALADDLDLSGLIISDYAPERNRLAGLSTLVARAAELGDAEALAIFQAAASELADMTRAIRLSLGYAAEQRVPVSYSGGVFRAGAVVLGPFERALERQGLDYTLTQPLFDPGIGAALYAARRAGSPLSATALERLRSMSRPRS